MAFKRPPTKMANRSQSASASSMLCVVNNMDARFDALYASTTSHNLRRLQQVHQEREHRQVKKEEDRYEAGSRPVEGSSRRTIRGWAISAMATHNLRFMPPENCLEDLCLCFVSCT